MVQSCRYDTGEAGFLDESGLLDCNAAGIAQTSDCRCLPAKAVSISDLNQPIRPELEAV